MLALLVLEFYSCSTNNENNIIQVYVEKGIEKPKQLYLSEISDKVTYITLQTDSNCIIGGYDRVQLTDNYVIVFGERCLLFDRSGNFIRYIGKKGRGPQEYENASTGFYYDKFYIPAGKNIKVYKLDGSYLKTLKRENLFLWQYPIGNGLFLGYKSYMNKFQEWCLAICTENGLLKTVPIKDQLSSDNGIQAYDECIVCDTNGKVIFKELYNDTIYSISPDLIIKPEYKLNLNKLLVPLSSKVGWTKENIKKKMDIYYNDYFRANFIFFGAKYVFVNFTFQGKKNVGYFNIKGGNFFTSLNDRKDGCFINDIDGGPDFVPAVGNHKKGELATLVWPYDLFQRFEVNQDSDFGKNSGINFPGLKEKDNPIVMIVKLKD